MLTVLGDADFVHPLPTYLHPGPRVKVAPLDLSRRADRRSVLGPIHRSLISLTGVVHTLSSYRRLPYGWRTTPQGVPTDQYMWRQYLSAPQVRAVSASRATTLKLAATSRRHHQPDSRAAEIQAWWRLSHEPGFVPRWDAAIAAAVRACRWRSVPYSMLATALARLPVPAS